MSVTETLDGEIKNAMRAKDQVKLEVVRLIKSAVKYKEIEIQHPLTDAEFLAVLSSMVKQRRDSIEQFRKGSREDLAQQEELQVKVIEQFLPSPLTESELDQLIAQAIQSTGAQGPKGMGQVMAFLKDKVAGRSDGRLVSEKVKAALGS